MEDSGFIGDPRRIRVLNGVATALIDLEAAGFLRLVVTNQSGVARGLFGARDVENVNRALRDELAREGASIDGFYYCTHLTGCTCRKPLTGLADAAVRDHAVDLRRSVVFGDRGSDIGLAVALGIPGILVNPVLPYVGPEPLFRASSLRAGVTYFLDAVAA